MTESERKNVPGWCTKYALTVGVYPITVDIIGKYAYRPGIYQCQFSIGSEFFESLNDAKADAMRRAAQKIKQLDKQRSKMLGLVAVPTVLDKEPE